MIKHLIFDLDRTVYPAHTEMGNRISYLIKKYAADFWHVDFDEGAKLRHKALLKYGTTLDWLVEEGGFTDIEAYFAFVHPEDECSGLPKAPALLPLLESLPQRKLILTNSPYEHAERVLRHLGVREQFDAICDIRMNKLHGKPAADAFYKALELCGGTISDTLFLDDCEGYTDGWAALGGTAVLVSEEPPELCTAGLAGKTVQIKDIYELPALLASLGPA
mgnify:FL=1